MATAVSNNIQQPLPPQDQDPNTASYPLAAQIPLKEFTLPDFPPEASHLRELTLTSDIKLDDYQSLVTTQSDAIVTQAPLPNLPASITHLTLELFSLGFPGTPPFLTRIARSLPNLRSVTFFSCLIDGVDEHSRKDAEKFFELATGLSEVHVIDSFGRPGFWNAVGKVFDERAKNAEGRDGLKLVDVSYTFRGHEDEDFLARVQGEELAGLVGKGVFGANFDFVPEQKDDLEEAHDAKSGKEEKLNEGILPFATDGRAPTATRKRFESLSHGGQLKDLKVLNIAMWTLRAAEVAEIIYACAGGSDTPSLADLTVSVLLEENWADKFAESLSHHEGVASELESIEIVGVPDRAKEEGDDWKADLSVVKKADVEKIAVQMPKLAKFGMSILKVKSAPNVLFDKVEGEGWNER